LDCHLLLNTTKYYNFLEKYNFQNFFHRHKVKKFVFGHQTLILHYGHKTQKFMSFSENQKTDIYKCPFFIFQNQFGKNNSRFCIINQPTYLKGFININLLGNHPDNLVLLLFVGAGASASVGLHYDFIVLVRANKSSLNS